MSSLYIPTTVGNQFTIVYYNGMIYTDTEFGVSTVLSIYLTLNVHYDIIHHKICVQGTTYVIVNSAGVFPYLVQDSEKRFKCDHSLINTQQIRLEDIDEGEENWLHYLHQLNDYVKLSLHDDVFVQHDSQLVRLLDENTTFTMCKFNGRVTGYDLLCTTAFSERIGFEPIKMIPFAPLLVVHDAHSASDMFDGTMMQCNTHDDYDLHIKFCSGTPSGWDSFIKVGFTYLAAYKYSSASFVDHTNKTAVSCSECFVHSAIPTYTLISKCLKDMIRNMPHSRVKQHSVLSQLIVHPEIHTLVWRKTTLKLLNKIIHTNV